MKHTIFLFGEAEKGPFCTPLPIYSLIQLSNALGHPPENTLGLFFAIQAILYERDLIFYRVKEEGFSYPDYMHGIRILKNENLVREVTAICLPGVGDRKIFDALEEICLQRNSFLITSDQDLYDFLTDVK